MKPEPGTNRDSQGVPGGLGAVFSPHGELISAVIAGVLLLAGWGLRPWSAAGTISEALYWASLGVGMIHGLRAAWVSVSRARFDIDVLMAVGAGLAASIGHPEEGALLLFLFVLSGALEALAGARTTRAVEALHRLIPTATLRWDDARRDWAEVAPEALAPGDRVKVKPGELIPADGVIHEGETSLDQSTLTGESVPRDARAGDEVYSGTVNVGNPVEVRVTRPVSESSVSRVLKLVLEAQARREPVQRFIDRFNEPYALGVLALSVVVMLVWWLGLGRAATDAAYTAITLLIVASPCALIISTPTATLAGIARGARAGVLFKGGQSIDRLARVRAMAFDKTGTLTIGRPRLTQFHPVAWSDGHDLLGVAAALERDSTHPIAKAILEAAAARGVPDERAVEVKNVVGRGVTGLIDGVEARLGNFAHTEALIPVCLRARVRELLGKVQERGQIGVITAWREQAAVGILVDAVRPGAPELVRELHRQSVAPVVMLTGDNRLTAERVAASLGLDEWHAELLPADKVDQVGRLRRRVAQTSRRGGVGVIGDGVNDAPALAAADVSIAIGSIGSDAALESADIVLLSDDLGVVPWAIGLARAVRRTVKLNLAFSLSAIVMMGVSVLAGSLAGWRMPLWLGVLGHEGGTLLVVANSLWLLAYRSRRGDPSELPREHIPHSGGVPQRTDVIST
ncbi:MAG: cation-translocating P-type ATPase [Phycisphaerae bacterium]|nr:cation-translocating P-type ATPase [Phycisphaerae bacterium]